MSRKSQRNRKRHQMQVPLLRAARQYRFKARRARRAGATPLTDSEAVAAASELLRAAARWHQEGWPGASWSSVRRNSPANHCRRRRHCTGHLSGPPSLWATPAIRAARNRQPWRVRFLTRPSRCHTGSRQQTCPQPRLRRQKLQGRFLLNAWRGPTTLSRSKADPPRQEAEVLQVHQDRTVCPASGAAGASGPRLPEWLPPMMTRRQQVANQLQREPAPPGGITGIA